MFVDGKEIKRFRFYGKIITSVRYGTKLVWQAIRSCFGAGWWVDEKPWINEENWNNNN